MTELSTELLIVLLIALILLSGFFSGSETGMMSLNRYRLRHLARKGRTSAQRVMKLLERPDRLLGVILIGNTFANILASAVATVIAVHYLGDLGVIVSTIVLTLVILIVAETAPKTFAALHPEKVANAASIPLKWLLKILYPFVVSINMAANGLLRLFGVKVKKRTLEPLSADELQSVVREAKGKISATYQEMLLRILELEQVTIEDVMVPRNEIHGIDIAKSWAEIAHALTHSEHAYMPMYQEHIDQVLGMLNMRVVLSRMQKGKLTKDDLRRLAERVYFVPEGALLHRQLLNFQDENHRVGLVVDEYGDIQGLVSLQDVLEEIVGEFSRDLDDVMVMIQPQKDGSFMVDGRISLRDLNRQTHWNLPTEGPKTLSGLLIDFLEMIPAPGIAARVSGYPMEVKEMSGNTVRLVQVWPSLSPQSAHEK